MQIKPRQHLLDMWQAWARHSFAQGVWSWGEQSDLSSVADAERLLCLLYPATEIQAFRLDDPNTTQRDVTKALRDVGDSTDIPSRLIEILGEFMKRHHDGEFPTFAGGHYFSAADPEQELSKEQREFDVVDSYSMSVSLCLATLGFLQVYRNRTNRASAADRIEQLRKDTGERLTAAMVGLLRSFAVDVVEISSDQGHALARLLGQGRLSDRQVVQRFQHRFKSLRALITDSLALGLDTDVCDELRNENRLFECGWAWGVVKNAPVVATGADPGGRGQPDGVAHPVPGLHFTVVALDGIIDLLSERTLTLGLLDAEQQHLASALRLRFEITQQYWSGVARFDEDAWPLEEIPWRTTPRQLESEYFSLTIVSVLVHDLMRRRATEHDVTRIVAVMERLAERARITGRPLRDDPAVALHGPGIAMPLLGSDEPGPAMTWVMNDFSTQLLKRAVQLSSLSTSLNSQDRLLQLAESVLDHVWRRRITDGAGVGLWDDVRAVHPESPAPVTAPSWSITERVAECMVAAHGLYDHPPIRSAELSAAARAAIGEAAHLLGREQKDHPAPPSGTQQGEWIKGVEADLRRARELIDRRPGTSLALALGVLERLDALARVTDGEE
ncbi:SCO2524 family protein [Streptomyces sp. NPDC005236]|uniref:SCO2524 family protein n=1 Tax=Streptomyces sp. NPDC005236 TaxID=3157028 RepID=UPI0033A942F7